MSASGLSDVPPMRMWLMDEPAHLREEALQWLATGVAHRNNHAGVTNKRPLYAASPPMVVPKQAKHHA